MQNEFEQALLGAILIDPRCISTINIEETDFTSDIHREIWRAINTLKTDGQDVDYLTVTREIEKNGTGGTTPYITTLTCSVPSSLHVESYAVKVKDASRRRRLLEVASKIANIAADINSDLDTSIPGIVELLVNTARVTGGSGPLISVMSALYDDVLEKHKNPRDIWGIPTGFTHFDLATGGMQTDELTILSGVPGVGKSMLAMQIATQMAAHCPGVIYSMEMTGKSVARRMVSGHAKIPTRALKTGYVSDKQWGEFGDTIGHFEKLPILFSDATGWTTTAMRADAARLKVTYNIQWFLVDYLFLLKDGKGQNEIDRTTQISGGLRQIARDLHISGLAVHSMNKVGMAENNPGQENLRGSGQVGYDADVIAFLNPYLKQVDSDYISQRDWPNMRILQFSKGREMENSHKIIKLVKNPDYPEFMEYVK